MQPLLIACESCHRQYDVTGMEKGESLRCACAELIKVPDKPAHEARMIHCSACGGKLKARAHKCDYCGCEVSLADRNLGPACPECFARLRSGARFCSECGIKIQPRVLRGVRASASCPRCRSPMVIREVPQGHYTECTKCGGIWLDVKSFDRLVERKDEAAIGTLLEKMKKSGEDREAFPETVRYIPCPECGNLMHRKNYAKCSGIVIDWCKGHGFWFDGDELEKTIRFVQSGGLDKARRLEIERARSEISRLEDRKRAVAHAGMGGGAGAWRFERESSDLSIDLGDVLGSAVSALVRRFF